jgi:hypothetical protein
MHTLSCCELSCAKRQGVERSENKTPGNWPGVQQDCLRDRDEGYETFKFSAEVLPRFSTSSYSMT